MSTWNDKRLGVLALDEGFAVGEIAFNGRPVSVCVEISEEEAIDVTKDCDLLGQDPQAFLVRAMDAARDPLHGAAALYVEHHAAELDSGTLDALLGSGVAHSEDALRAILFPKALHVPDPTDDEDEEIIVDISLPDDVTPYLLAIAFDQAGTLLSVEMES